MSAGATGWGYQGRQVSDLIAFARATGARSVVDVRLNPISRKAGFSKRSLSQALADAGLRYLHLPSLGNPRDNREGYADASSTAGRAARARYASEVLGSEVARDALDQVRALAASEGVVLLCFEADGHCCHRAEVLSAIDATRVAA